MTTDLARPISDQRIPNHPSERRGYVDAAHNIGGSISVTVSVPLINSPYYECVTRGLHPTTARALAHKLLALADEHDARHAEPAR